MSRLRSHRPRVRRVILVVVFTLGWCGLWGEVSVANLASGILVAVGVSALGIGSPARGGVRLVPLVRYVGLVLVDLVVSTWSVVREVLTPTDFTQESIVAVTVPVEARRHLLLLVGSITVTPGTAVVDADPDTGTLYLHLLHHDRHDEVVAHVRELAELACRALPVDPRPSPIPDPEVSP